MYLVYTSNVFSLIFSLFQSSTHPSQTQPLSSIVHIHRLDIVSCLALYIQENPAYFPSVKQVFQGTSLAETLYGSVMLSGMVGEHCRQLKKFAYPKLGVKHPIHSPLFQGFMTWSVRHTKLDVFSNSSPAAIKVSLPGFTVIIESGKGCVSEINKFIRTITDTSKVSLLSKNIGITMISDNQDSPYQHTHQLPPLPPLDGDVLARHEFNSYFHPRRAEILMMIISVQFNKELLLSKSLSTSIGILAHGPPGCGKSLLGFKIARALKRMPISVDLSAVDDMAAAYRLLYRFHIETANLDASDVVVLMDEFDEVVTRLDEREKELSSVSVSEPSSTKNINKQPNRLTINGLLKLLQGPLPHDGSIKVATTNKFDEILNIREAIVRPGRLTPLLCTYPDKVVVDQMSNHFFGVPFDEDIPHLEGTPTSALTAMASSLLIQYKDDLVSGAQAFHEKILEIADRL